MPKYDYLILSPHFDDAVLSCSARILAASRQKKKILVATVFSETSNAPDDLEKSRQRKDEDDKAMSFVGADSVWLGFADAPWRSPHYSSFSRIIGQPAASDFEFQQEVGRRIANLWQEVQPETTLLPLAVGEHIDHRIVYQARHALPPYCNLEFYEDRPYVFPKGMLELRLTAIAGSDEDRDLRRFRELLSNLSAVHIYKSGRAALTYGWLLAMARRIRKPPVDAPLLEPRLIKFEEADLQMVLNAMSFYDSQIKGLFGTLAEYEEECRAYAALLSEAAYAERYWIRIHTRRQAFDIIKR